MRLLVTGSRDWDDYDTLVKALVSTVLQWHRDHPELGDGPTTWVTVVHGACPTGADRMADGFATEVAVWPVERHPARWGDFGRRAGFVRNDAMVAAGADVCLAFIKNNSRGATMTADLAEAAGIRTVRYTA